MLKAVVTLFLIYSPAIYLCRCEMSPGHCGRGIFQLSLHGRKQDDDKWNITYQMERSSCNSTKNWNFYIFQNVTDHGNTKRLYLRGYVAENANEAGADGSKHHAVLCQIQETSQEKDMIAPDASRRFKDINFKDHHHRHSLKIISRKEWMARDPTKVLDTFVHPVKRLYVYQRNASCSAHQDCILAVRKMQEKDMRSYGDIFGNFHSAGDGLIYEGIGWDGRIDSDFNLIHLTSGTNPPSPQQMASLALLIREGVLMGKISEEYELRGFGNFPRETETWISWIKNVL